VGRPTSPARSSATLRCGAVGALKGYRHAITVARRVMEELPHVFLVGEGAARFAGEIGETPDAMLTAEARDRHREWLDAHIPEADRAGWPAVALARHAWTSAEHVRTRGTTVFLAIDARGEMAGGTSTSGWAEKYPGRLGDSPLIGAGLYVDQRYGACGCTHTGEMAIRAGTARAVVLYMKGGATVQEACHEAVADLRALQGGLLGPVAIHAIDREGRPHVVTTLDFEGRIVYCHWRDGLTEPEIALPVVDPV
jgi:L-asparaginase / beta-aspartyl-peptidase